MKKTRARSLLATAVCLCLALALCGCDEPETTEGDQVSFYA